MVNKPRGMVVHPAAGRTSGTLVNALLAHTKDLAAGSGSYRPGIVHRLDRDTSGLLVVAKTDSAYAGLSRQVRKHEMDRRYLALVWGDVREDRLVIDVPIGRHERERTRMEAVVGPRTGRTIRAAHTDVSVLQRSGGMTLVEALLGTGRTHQIRVHLAHIGHPVVGDPVYGLRQARRQKAALPADVLKLVQQLGGSPKESGSPRRSRERAGAPCAPPEIPPPEHGSGDDLHSPDAARHGETGVSPERPRVQPVGLLEPGKQVAGDSSPYATDCGAGPPMTAN